jgi:hypothetical protein
MRVLNTKENEVEIEEPLVEPEEIGLNQEVIPSCVNYMEIQKAILEQMRLGHLHEERSLLVDT